MSRRWCIPMCMANYDSLLKAGEAALTTFQFPNDDELRSKWMCAFPWANWETTKGDIGVSKMANIEDLEDGTNEIQQVPDAFEEHIEVVEQGIEDTKDQVVGDIKDLIFESLLPPYVPPPLPLGFEIESLYKCKECGDQFTFKSSYQFHKERRSLLICYNCPDCKVVVRVFNRCSFLSHMRQHGDPSHLTFDLSRVFISPLPFNKMLIGPLGNAPTEETSFPSSSLGISKPSSGNIDTKYCSECSIELKGDAREHFQVSVNDLSADHNYKCKYCHFILPTKCSLNAHERYHLQKRPFVCPDCAKIFRLWASFCVHLTYCCFHLDKCVQYRCPACKVCFGSSVALEVHILTIHVKNVFKCNACPIACFSLQALEVHKMKGHGQVSLPTNAYQQCQLCPDRLIPKSRLLFHVIEHVRKPSVCIYGYQCSGCKIFYHKKSDFAVHKAQCAEQPTSSAADIKNNVMVQVRKNTFESVINPNLLNGNLCVPSGISEGSILVPNDGILGRSSSRISSSQNNSNAQILKEQPKEVISGGDANGAKDDRKEKKGKDKISEVTVLVTDTVTVAHNISSDSILNSNDSRINCDDSSHVCDRCGQEITNKTNNMNHSRHCASCSDLQSQPKTRSQKNIASAAVSKNAQSEVTSTTGSTTTSTLISSTNICNNKKKTNKSATSQPAPTSRRRKCSIALNGPCNKKPKPSNSSEVSEKDMYKCHICKTLIGTEWEIVQDHFAKEHKNFNLLVLSPKINKLEPGSTVADSNFNKCGKNANNSTSKNSRKAPKIKIEPLDEEETREVSKARRSKRKIPPKEKPKEAPMGSGQVILTRSKKKLSYKYSCFKCKYENNDVQTFWSHIVTHKTDNRAYQCMECGMCFVVKPSFQKHLFISHKIRDVDKYIDSHSLCHQKPKRGIQDESESPSSPGDERGDERDDVEENQCRVCRAKFDTTVQLNKHFRTHGMAFLMMKQRENRNTPNH